MKLSHLQVSNYRGLREISIPLSNFVCITGENNSGKSSILQSLSLFLSGSALKPSDYFDPTTEILIKVTLSDVTLKDLGLLGEDHRGRIAALVQDGKLNLVRKYRTDCKSELGYFGLVPKESRFSADEVTKLVTGKKPGQLKDAVLVSFPELADQINSTLTQKAARELIEQLGIGLPLVEKEMRFIALPTGIDKSVIPMLPERIYIPAVKDLSDETKAAESSSFGKILAIVMKTIEPLLAEEQNLFEKLSRKLTRVLGVAGDIEDHRLNEIKKIEDTIQSYVRESFANVSLEIEIPPPELKSVLSTARILADDGVKGPLELKGDGLRRAVVFSILRAYVELARVATKGEISGDEADRGYLMLFEEPELFLHPDAQKSGKGSISRYRSFFKRFEVPIFVITDLDTIGDGFDKLDPTEVSQALRSELLQLVDKANADTDVTGPAGTEAIREAQGNQGLQHLWSAVRAAKTEFDKDASKFAVLDAAVDLFFAWEKKNIRRDCIRKAEKADINAARLALIWELRKDGIFVLQQGALEDYFPAEIKGADKPSKAQAFRNAITVREQVLPLSSQQTCPITGKVSSEFEFIFSRIFS